MLDWLRDNGKLVKRGGIGVVLLGASVFLIVRAFPDPELGVAPPPQLFADVRRIKSGAKIELDDDTILTYAAIRAPLPQEPYSEQAKKRNAELVERKRIRLRFDDVKEDSKGRKFAYVFVDGEFINETLVSEGFAYVRLTPDTQRFADRLLEAQKGARKARRGLWKSPAPKREKTYAADPKYGNFHRPSCEETAKINPDRRVNFSSRAKAFGDGFAPCPKCKP